MQDGHIATIRIPEEAEEDDDGLRSVNSVVEAMSLLDEVREGAEPGQEEEDRWRRSAPSVNTRQLGGTIVNSVTLHRPPNSKNDDDVLAVLTLVVRGTLEGRIGLG